MIGYLSSYLIELRVLSEFFNERNEERTQIVLSMVSKELIEEEFCRNVV